MRDGIDFLENRELRDRVEAVGDKEAFLSDAVKHAEECIALLETASAAHRDACLQGLQSLADAVGAFARKSVQGSFGFVDRDALFSRICTLLICVEEARNALQEQVLLLLDDEELACDARNALLSAQAIAAVIGDKGAVARAEAHLRAVDEEYSTFRSRAMLLFYEQLPKFAWQMQQHADFAHKGADADAATVLRLCETFAACVSGVNE